jgi:hypothetical protein
LRRKPKDRNTNDVMEIQPDLIRDKKRSEQHFKVTVRIASFVGSKVVQGLVRHGQVSCLTIPWIASMIDEWVWYWQGKTEVLGKKNPFVPTCITKVPHGLSWNRTRTYATKCWRKAARAMAIYMCVRVCKPASVVYFKTLTVNLNACMSPNSRITQSCPVSYCRYQ